MLTSLLAAFVHQASCRPQAIALIVWLDGRPCSFTWSRLATLVVDVAANLDADRIGFASENELADVILALSCMASGAIEVPIDDRLGDGVQRLWRRVDGRRVDGRRVDGRRGNARRGNGGNARWLTHGDRQQLITSALAANDSAAAIERLQQQCDGIQPHKPALVLWTSGTTCTPKGVVLSHGNLLGNAQAKLAAVPQHIDDLRLTSLPLCHAYARTCDFGTWLLSGCTLAVGRGWDAWQTLGPVTRPTLTNTVPSIARRLRDARAGTLGLDRLRLLGCGGAAMSEAEFLAWRDRGVIVIQGYGLTETSPVISSATPDNAAAGLVGKLVDGWESEIRDGRLFVRGPQLMLGYWDDPQATARRITGDGWLDTGDLVEWDPATEQLRILGRADDVIVLSDGHKVHPQALEQEIESIAGIQHAIIIGDDRNLAAWIDADDSMTLDVITASISGALVHRPTWERPQSVGRFDPPLSAARGELTHKGVVQRERIRETRPELFAIQSGTVEKTCRP